MYEKKVRVVKQYVREDPPVGTVGQVLSEAEHGITRQPGFTTLNPDFPGIRGYHFLVRFDESQPPKMLDVEQLAFA